MATPILSFLPAGYCDDRRKCICGSRYPASTDDSSITVCGGRNVVEFVKEKMDEFSLGSSNASTWQLDKSVTEIAPANCKMPQADQR